MKNKKLVLTINLLFTIIFLFWVNKEVGQLRDISSTAKHFPALFFAWIWLTGFTMAYVGYRLLPGLAAGFLVIIGTLTGVNEQITIISKELQVILHVVFVNLAIVLMLLEILLNGTKIGLIKAIIEGRKFKELIKYIKRPFNWILVIGCIIFTVYAIISGMKAHTYWIECYILGSVNLYYFVKK